MGNDLTVETALKLIQEEAQWARENGGDMRYIITLIDDIREDMEEGLSDTAIYNRHRRG